MKEKNDYGMYSGAFIFDILDRAALKYVREKSGVADNAVLVTATAYTICFRRQVCSKKGITTMCCDYTPTRDGFFCTAQLIQNDTVCADGRFLFKFAHNHCEIAGATL